MSERDTRLYIEDMLEFCGKALAYSSTLTEATLTAEAMRYDAILRNLELIGEAATHVPEALRAWTPDIPWRQIVATRNRVAHAYLGISADTVWSILHDDLPALDLALSALLARMNEEPPVPGG
ncbi:MAG: DUF86 domain-containing protein [Rubrivivax sp.]|nr:MAG: DUF86 domain-containing protein [Rubrivivax sp.]